MQMADDRKQWCCKLLQRFFWRNVHIVNKHILKGKFVNYLSTMYSMWKLTPLVTICEEQRNANDGQRTSREWATCRSHTQIQAPQSALPPTWWCLHFLQRSKPAEDTLIYNYIAGNLENCQLHSAKYDLTKRRCSLWNFIFDTTNHAACDVTAICISLRPHPKGWLYISHECPYYYGT